MTDGGGVAGNKKKYAVYLESDQSLIGQTIEEDPGTNGAGWYGLAASGTVNLSADTKYIICAWANFTTSMKVAAGMASNNTKQDTETYNGFPAPATFTNVSFSKEMSVYCTYTEESAGVSPRRRRVLLEANR
jgi:hypothetical protein